MKNSPVLPLRLTVKTHRSETISQLARRHLTDQRHTTTDEELLHAKVELSGSSDVDDELSSTVIHPFPAEEPPYDNLNKSSKNTASNNQ